MANLDQLDVSAPIAPDSAIFTILNRLLSGLWRGCVQHQTHIAVIEAQGLQGLADAMRVRTADEPIAIRALLNRLVDLGGTPALTIEALAIGADRKSTRLNSSHDQISYAVFCLKKKKKNKSRLSLKKKKKKKKKK